VLPTEQRERRAAASNVIDPEQLIASLEGSLGGFSRLVDDLATRRLLVVSGKGGVGRTTVSALLGLALAARGRNVVLATTALDDRLAWMLGAESLQDQPVAIVPGLPNLRVQRLVPATALREYGTLILRSERVARVVFDNRIVRRLLTAIPGMDDFTVLGKVWHEAFRARSCDVLIFDGPATGHLRLNLGTAAAVLETVPAGPIAAEARAIDAALRDPKDSAAVLVGLPEPWPLTELAELATDLQRDVGLHVGAIVINGLLPAVGALREDEDSASASPALQAAVAGLDDLVARAHAQRVDVATFVAQPGVRLLQAAASHLSGGRGEPLSRITTLPWRGHGLDDLASLRALLAELDGSSSGSGGAP
jgi:anion-transporting  ArsA/GET3 family ATPase